MQSSSSDSNSNKNNNKSNLKQVYMKRHHCLCPRPPLDPTVHPLPRQSAVPNLRCAASAAWLAEFLARFLLVFLLHEKCLQVAKKFLMR